VRSFAYARPENLTDVLSLLAEHGPRASLLAGGTDLVVRLRSGRQLPELVIDLKRVKGLSAEVVETGGVLRVGARTVMTDLIGDARIRRYFPALVEAASVVGSIQIRNRATLAGNICNASPAADTAPALLVYEAVVNVVGLEGERSVPLEQFFAGPGRTVLRRGEIVRSIDLPVPAERVGAAFGRVTRRYGVDLASINLCCAVRKSGITSFAFGAVGPRPFVSRDASGVLADRSLPGGERDAALRRMIEGASPISDIRASREYRWAMLLVTSRRALQSALDRLYEAPGESPNGA
jgi:carbon-monoxide dehydrogenase medium subunit